MHAAGGEDGGEGLSMLTTVAALPLSPLAKARLVMTWHLRRGRRNHYDRNRQHASLAELDAVSSPLGRVLAAASEVRRGVSQKHHSRSSSGLGHARLVAARARACARDGVPRRVVAWHVSIDLVVAETTMPKERPSADGRRGRRPALGSS